MWAVFLLDSLELNRIEISEKIDKRMLQEEALKAESAVDI